MRLVTLLVVLGTVSVMLTACGGGAKSSQSSRKGVVLTETEIPDVLMDGVWPGAGLRAYRDGDAITIYTDWAEGEKTVDGRTTTDAATSICAAVINDLELGPDGVCPSFG